ncbi:MAG: hypothetical protein ACLQQB_04025 [Solirubrobacteraceae bacterium]
MSTLTVPTHRREAPQQMDARTRAPLPRVAAQMVVDPREQAALRRLSAQMIAEANELAPTTWAAQRLRLEVDGWGERVLPELAVLMAVDRTQDSAQSWIRTRSVRCPLALEEEASLRRVAALLRAEAAELGSESSVGARLDSWGIRLAVECENPGRPQIV